MPIASCEAAMTGTRATTTRATTGSLATTSRTSARSRATLRHTRPSATDTELTAAFPGRTDNESRNAACRAYTAPTPPATIGCTAVKRVSGLSVRAQISCPSESGAAQGGADVEAGSCVAMEV
ncbi:MAG: hypothetical protein JWP52_2898 [Rhizobacter sp.]|nr:hypothetical protein [Rhizobacter sp.]